MEKIINVPTEVLKNIQNLHTEVDSRKELIAFILTTNMPINSSNFNIYQNEYVKYYNLFEEAKNNFEQEYVRANVNNPISWSLNYKTSQVTIIY